jgi:hypothetical protein
VFSEGGGCDVYLLKVEEGRCRMKLEGKLIRKIAYRKVNRNAIYNKPVYAILIGRNTINRVNSR